MPASVIASALLGAALGYPARRLSGLYLALTTLGFLELVGIVIEEFPDYTGGIRGLKVAKPDIFGLTLQSNASLYFFVFVLTMAAIVVGYNVQRSRYGRAFDAVRQSPFAAQALGIPVARVKVIAFSLNAAFAGFAGGLYAIFNGFISSDALYWTASGDILIMTMLGGAGTLIGPPIGAAVFLLMKNVASSYSEHWLTIIGVIFICCVMFFPGGIWGTVEKLRWGGARS